MLKMPSFGINTRSETFVPLIYCIIADFVPSHTRPSSDAAPVHRSHEVLVLAPQVLVLVLEPQVLVLAPWVPDTSLTCNQSDNKTSSSSEVVQITNSKNIIKVHHSLLCKFFVKRWIDVELERFCMSRLDVRTQSTQLVYTQYVTIIILITITQWHNKFTHHRWHQTMCHVN